MARANGKLPTYTKKALQANAEGIAELNREQLEKGLDSENKDLGIYRDFAYKNRFRPVDLKLTGDFHRSIKPEFASESFNMVATDEKTEKLQDKYGDDIIGLSDKSIEELGTDIIGQVQYELRKELEV